jgi:hypothetical protein
VLRQRANVMRESGVRLATSSAGTTRHGQTDVPATGSSALSGDLLGRVRKPRHIQRFAALKRAS